MNFEQERRALIRIRTCPRLELQDTSKSQLYSMKVKALVDKTSQTVIKDLPPPHPPESSATSFPAKLQW